MPEENKSFSDMPAVKAQENVYTAKSDRTGLQGLIEGFLRRFRIFGYLAALVPVYLLAIFTMSLAAIPGIFLFDWLTSVHLLNNAFEHYFLIAAGLIGGYFAYGFTLLLIIPVINFLLPFRVKPFRGQYYSIQTVPWYFHNALTYIARYTFLEFATPTPINIWFYRRMGMKIGKDCHINTTNISDPALIEIEDKVTIGGSVHLIAHYASKGFLIVEKVVIREGATIGLKATIMGDVEIGAKAIIAPHEVVFPKSRIPAGRKPEINNH